MSTRFTRYAACVTLLVVATLVTSTLPVFGDEAPSAVVDSAVADKISHGGSANVIVQLKDFTTEELTQADNRSELKEDQSDIVDDADLTKHTRTYDRIPALATKVNADQLDELKNDPRVESIRLETYFTPEQVTTEPTVYSRPLLNEVIPLVGADDVWSSTGAFRGEGKKVVIIDTGVKSDHAFLAGAVTDEVCYAMGQNGYSTGGSCPNGQDSQTGTGAAAPCTAVPSSCSHGTHVAGIAAGRTDVGGNAPVGGVAPDASIVAIQVFSTVVGNVCGGPSVTCVLAAESDLIDALDWVLAHSANVAAVNMSLGGDGYSSNCDADHPQAAQAVNSLRAIGIATVVSSGNNGKQLSDLSYTGSEINIGHPACLSGVISVGSTSKLDVVESYSDSNSLVELWAPGSSVYSSIPTGYGTKSGTSMAAPVITGSFALLREAFPSESVSSLLLRLQQSGTSITDARNNVTRSRPNLLAAITMNTPVPADTNGYAFFATNGAVVGKGIYAPYTRGSRSVTKPVIGGAVNSAQHNGGWSVSSDGNVYPFGETPSYGSLAGRKLTVQIMAMAASTTGHGYRLLGSNGGVAVFGDAKNYGSLQGRILKSTMMAIVSTPTGKGYWLLGSDGGVACFGDARNYGSLQGRVLKSRMVGIAPTPTGKGYWITGSDGGVAVFGDARNRGNLQSTSLSKPVVSIKANNEGTGYWLFTADGKSYGFNVASSGAATGQGLSFARVG